MDFGDLVFMVLIGIGLLSSAFGKKKKKPGQPRAGTAPSRPARPQQRRPAPPPQTQARKDVASAMQDILKQLQLVPPDEPPAPPPPKARLPDPPSLPSAPVPETRSREPRVQRPQPSVRAQRPPPPQLEPVLSSDWEDAVTQPEAAPLGAQTHTQFHREFVKPVRLTRAHRSGAARVRRFMSREGLKDAILAYEIFGPPKGVR